MPTTAANYADIAKEVFDSDTLEKMFYDENPFLDRLEKQKRVIIGKRAQVPLHTQRAGGTSVHSAAGGTLNTADGEDVDRAEYSLAYTWFPVQIEFGALNEISGGTRSVGEALEHMCGSAIMNSRNQVTRQVLTGDALVAQCGVTAAATTVVLSVTPSAGRVSGVDALQAGWVVPGDKVDLGTAADADSVAADRTVTSVSESLTAPSFVISGAAVTTDATHFVTLANSRGDANTVVESTGLKEIFGNTNNTVGAIDASTNTFWNPAEVDTTSTLIDLDLLLRLNRRVTRKAGRNSTFHLTSLKQLDNVYSFLQSQVRFTGDKELGAGASETVKWRGMEIHAFPQVPENVYYTFFLDHLEMVLGAYDKPTWASDVAGNNKGQVWAAGTTHFDDAIVYATGLAARRRNAGAAAVGLTG